MLGEGVQRAIASYNAAISSCVKGVQQQQALGLFKRMQSERV
jgi:pentatricopeptide repeat protein